MTKQAYVIPIEMRDLLNMVRCLHLENLHCVQDGEIPVFIEKWPEKGLV
ncbi:hypothetical protein [Legionella bononiensis]|nr:hypothetical protein [Legionella bononiensis]